MLNMALIKVDFFSQSLMRTVTINALIPVDKVIEEEQEFKRKQYKTLTSSNLQNKGCIYGFILK